MFDTSICASIIFEPVHDQVQIASALFQYCWRKDVCSEPSAMTSIPTSINELPDEILLKISSHAGTEDLSLIIAKVCKRFNNLARDLVLWKKLSYHCDDSSDINRTAEV